MLSYFILCKFKAFVVTSRCLCRCAKKFVMMYEHLVLEPGLADRMQVQRVAVPSQGDAYSCGWRTAFNASLLCKRVLGIPSVSKVTSSCLLPYFMYALIDKKVPCVVLFSRHAVELVQ